MGSSKERIGGYRYDKEDIGWLKDNSLSDALVKEASQGWSRPATVDPRSWSKIRNQGQEGSCQGHSITACGEQCYHVKTDKVISFSPDAAYYLTQKFDGLLGGDNGSTIAGGMKVATEIGFCLESDMPYTDRYNPQSLPSNIKELCAPYKTAKHKVFKGPDFFAETVDWIGNGFGGVSFGIPWTIKLDAKGVASWYAANAGGHAQAVLGYLGRIMSNGLPEYLLVKNSWGDWGPLHGWYFIPQDVYNRAMAHNYSVVVGISDMASLKPRKISWAENYPS